MGQGGPPAPPSKAGPSSPLPSFLRDQRLSKKSLWSREPGSRTQTHPKSCLGAFLSRKATSGLPSPGWGCPAYTTAVLTSQPHIGYQVQEQPKTDPQVRAVTAPGLQTARTSPAAPAAAHSHGGRADGAPTQGKGKTNEGTN